MAAYRAQIDELFRVPSSKLKSAWDVLKSEPGKPSRSQFAEVLAHQKMIESFTTFDSLIFDGIPTGKLQQFALEAKSLDAARMSELTSRKRYALAASGIKFFHARSLDDLGEMFIKRMMKIHRNGQEALNRYQVENQTTTDRLLLRFQDVLLAFRSNGNGKKRLTAITESIGTDADKLENDLAAQLALSENNYYSFLEPYYNPYRKVFFNLIGSVQFVSTTQETGLSAAIEFIKAHRNSHAKKIATPQNLNLNWVPDKWWKLIAGQATKRDQVNEVDRKSFEICLFSQLLWELKSGDFCIPGSEQFSDYREQLLSWDEYQSEIKNYGEQAGIETNPKKFVAKTKGLLAEQAKKTDESFPDNESLRIENGEPILKRDLKKNQPSGLRQIEQMVAGKIEPVNILDALVDTENWINWTRPFGPLSGLDAKIKNQNLKYVLTAFCYGSNLGPTQTARSVSGTDRRQIAWINQRHISEEKLDEANKTVINAYAKCSLPKIWGTGKHASADGTKWQLYEQNLLSEYHVRYGGYGGIGYYHVSDNYIALFSHFIPCGVWEAVYILDGLLKNNSDIQPDTVHGDTQAQSAPVFALAFLLGIDLMPRIRNWKDLKFLRPDPSAKYNHLDQLLSTDVDWDLIETHLQDMLRVAVSIKAGKVSASTILRRLGTYSRKNRLYFAFRELGQVVRTIFLLRYLNDKDLRTTIQSATNKSEAFNNYAQWVAFGGQGVIAENSRDEQRKIIKYNHLLSNLLILHTTYSMGTALKTLEAENCLPDPEAISFMSPYITEHINRFGNYRLDGDRHRPAPSLDLSWISKSVPEAQTILSL